MSDFPDSPAQQEKSKLNLDPNLAGALCYLFGCISGILFFLLETENKRVRFHALQSLLIFSVLAVISVSSAIFAIFSRFVFFEVINNVVWIIHFVVWLVMVIKTYQGSTVKLPVLGDFAQDTVGWP